MKVRLQESNVIDSIALSLWNFFREQNSPLSSEDQLNSTNSDAASRNIERPMIIVLRWAFGLFKNFIQLTNNTPAVSLGLRLDLTAILKFFE